MNEKQPFQIDMAIARIQEAVKPFPRAALFELAESGHTSIFELLVACMISIRTRDETMLPVARRLFAKARTPAEMSQLSPEAIDRLISASTFHEGKARQIHAIAQQAVAEYNGVLPGDLNVLLSLNGVGPKCAHLVLGIGCNLPYISVDIHVHRVTNRWGYVSTRTPETTLAALEKKLPPDYWIEINKLLVPFGKHICTGDRPRCSTCPVLEMCQQVGVEAHR